MSAAAPELDSFDAACVRIRDLETDAHLLLVSVLETDDAVEAVRNIMGIALPAHAGEVSGNAPGCAFWLSPRSWLLRMSDTGAEAALDAARTGFPDHSIHATPYSDALHWLEISGPGAGALLARGGFLTLAPDGFPVGHFKRTLLADIPVLIWRRDEETWEVACERSRARYFRGWLESSIAIAAVSL